MKILEFGFQERVSQLDSNQPLTVFLPGFPGIRSRQNRDLAEAVAGHLGRPAVTLLYSGLGHAPGRFSFERTLDDVRAFIVGLLVAHRGPIDLVGHSWGGFCSLVIANEFSDRVRKLVLLSPLLKFMSADVCQPSFSNAAASHPDLNFGDPSHLAQDFVRTGELHPTPKLIAGLAESIDVLFLQARKDEITLTSIAEEMREHFHRAPDFQLAENDHSFLSHREVLARQLADFLA